ncbi:MAG: DUF1080 domain-containing protein [Longimicrobiales bacterium]|nr:DUF1080 domain-containing protein [Longimicrobiales bacterium]
MKRGARHRTARGPVGSERVRTTPPSRAPSPAAAVSLLLAWSVTACGGPEARTEEGSRSAAGTSPASSVPHNTLTAEESAAGWRLLFDGETLEGWRGYGRDDVPETWVVRDGEMMLQTQGGNMDGGDLVTVEEYADFELAFDFKVGPEGNSGVFYRAREVDGKDLWQVAPEYQVLDDPAHPASADWDPRTHRTGENYDLHAADDRVVHPTGEWNSGRIVVEGDHVEHWLNGRKTVEYELHSDEWRALVEASKFAVEEHYARAPSGSIGLQDHGTPVWYRNVKIRRIDGG